MSYQMTQSELSQLFERSLAAYLRYQVAPLGLMESMWYSLSNGGKRIRPLLLLTLLNIQSLDQLKAGLRSAIALEFIHTYSLIHDDLPAMDDDDYRRGKLTNHKKFDEATAILAGDALLTDAFTAIVTDDLLEASQQVALVRQLAAAAGSAGMVGGQYDDVDDQADLSLEAIASIYQRKTGALFNFAVEAAIIIGEIEATEAELLRQFSRQYGQVYQVHNDLAEAINPEIVGKKAASDLIQAKETYIQESGFDQALADFQQMQADLYALIAELEVQSSKSYQPLKYFVDLFNLDEALEEADCHG